MRYVNLGATGLRVSRICLGMMSYGKHPSREWTLDEQGAEPIVRRAVEGGITFFDTADGSVFRDRAFALRAEPPCRLPIACSVSPRTRSWRICWSRGTNGIGRILFHRRDTFK